MCPLESAVTTQFKVRAESSFQSVPKIIAVLADEKAKTCLNIQPHQFTLYINTEKITKAITAQT